MKILISIAFVSLAACLLVPLKAPADGTFVAPKFVWDKHKDINEPTQKAIIVYDAGQEDLILQVKYEGPVDQFGWLIPVPNLPTVQKGSMKCFYELSQYTQQQSEPPTFGSPDMKGLGRHTLAASAAPPQPPPVKVIETKTVGAYEIAVLSARDSGALKQWLGENQFYLPPDKSDVIDSYVERQWYFIAVKINLRQWFPRLFSTASRLASGELNPLQINFATGHCVFPLKISSINGKPSEVQVYVLSPGPLLEKGMLEKQLPEIYSNEVVRAAAAKGAWADLPGGIFFAGPDDLLPFLKVNGTDLPDSSQWIPRLAGKSWWLLKQTWTFTPEDMRDLEFQPALPVFADMLGTRYGRFAAVSLTPFGPDAVPTILAAMQSTNPAVRATAAGTFNGGRWGYSSFGYESISDSRFAGAALKWLKDPEPLVRHAGVELLTSGPNLEPEQARAIIEMLGDENRGVRQAAVQNLLAFPVVTEQFNPVLKQMLTSKNPGAQASALQMLQGQQITVPRELLLSFLASSDQETLDAAWTQLQMQGEKLSDDEARALLDNRQIVGRMWGLDVLAQNPGKQSVELALPFLRDPDELVRLKAAETLQFLTGQNFTKDQAGDWTTWWDENKTHFAARGRSVEQTP